MNSVKYKSRAVSLFLTFCLGAFGLFYVSGAAAVIVLILSVFASPVIGSPIVVWLLVMVVSMVIGDSMCVSHNRDADKLRKIIEGGRND